MSQMRRKERGTCRGKPIFTQTHMMIYDGLEMGGTPSSHPFTGIDGVSVKLG